jgi:hypothetical protein
MIMEINNCHLQNGETIVKSAFMIAELAPNSVRTYRLAPEGFNVVRKKLLGQRAIIFTGIIIFTIIITFRQLDMDWQRVSFVSLAPYFILTMLLIGALATGLLKGMEQNREAWNTYELIIGEDFLIRRIKNFPELEIRRHEITSIKESPAGLQVETSSRDRTIGIASSLVDYEDARARLSQWMTPTRRTQQGWLNPARWMIALPLLVLLLFGLFLLSVRSWVLISTGTPLLAILVWTFILIRKSVQISDRVKRTSLLVFLPILAVATKLVMAIINWQ